MEDFLTTTAFPGNNIQATKGSATMPHICAYSIWFHYTQIPVFVYPYSPRCSFGVHLSVSCRSNVSRSTKFMSVIVMLVISFV